MYHTITESEFLDAFRGGNGWSDTYKNNFSYPGLLALFQYLESYEDDTGEKLKFDRADIAQRYSEYDNLMEFHSEYDKPEVKTLNDLSDHTIVINIPGRLNAFIMGVF